VLALETCHVGEAFNIGSGESRTILSVAEDLARVMGCVEVTPTLTGKYRAGDIRHCFADISKSRHLLGFAPEVRFDDGLDELSRYLSDQIAEDRADAATQELLQRGLVA
jgi:dTDP-L-rhamnose 4-epimerase